MSNLDLRLSDVTDSDRFIIIDLYKQHSLLWSRGITVSRDKSAVIWKEIAQNVSTSNRIFTVALVEKVVKNLRDQHARLLRRGGNSNWKFLPALSFLGTELPPPKSRHGKSRVESPISFVKIEEKPFLIEESSKISCGTKAGKHSTRKSKFGKKQLNSSNISDCVNLNDITDEDRFKIIELYHQQPILWNKSCGGQRNKIAEAWRSVINGVSTPERRFDLQLVQKIVKNLKDQYIRIKRRGCENSTWKYLKLLRFLDANPKSRTRVARSNSSFKKEINTDGQALLEAWSKVIDSFINKNQTNTFNSE